MKRLVRIHKIVGYTGFGILILHPMLVVAPRFFESGVAPDKALVTILTTLNTGVLLGMIAWCLMLLIGITTFSRNRLPMAYKTWRMVHGILALFFVATAAWHAIDLGRHSTPAMTFWIIFLALGGVLLFAKRYVSKPSTKTQEV